ncbi:hypothetical protein K439DRAFT_1637638 [Ramaria rubella]|nr:hypothetical protein K439DRAFT_1637638 [Ramaria rubella]
MYLFHSVELALVLLVCLAPTTQFFLFLASLRTVLLIPRTRHRFTSSLCSCQQGSNFANRRQCSVTRH